MAISRVMHWFVHMSHFYFITWPIQVLPRAQQSIHHKSNSRSSLLHRLTTQLFDDVYIIIQHDNQIQQITVYTSAATRWQLHFHHIKPAHEYTHQNINVHCIKPTELTTESYQKKSWSAWYPHVAYCTPIAVSWTSQTLFQSFLSSSSLYPLIRRG